MRQSPQKPPGRYHARAIESAFMPVKMLAASCTLLWMAVATNSIDMDWAMQSHPLEVNGMGGRQAIRGFVAEGGSAASPLGIRVVRSQHRRPGLGERPA